MASSNGTCKEGSIKNKQGQHESGTYNGNYVHGEWGIPTFQYQQTISMDWTFEEQALLEEGLCKYGTESSIIRYAKIALQLNNKTVRDVALRCKWMTRKEISKRRKEDFSTRKSKDRKEKVIDSLAKPSHLAVRSGLSHGPGVVSNCNDDIISYNDMGGTTHQLVQQNAWVFKQISTNLATHQICENIGLLSRARDNIFKILIRYKLYFSSSSSTLIYDNPDIPALIELKVDMSYVELNKAIVPVDFLKSKDGALENFLIWGRNKKNNGFRLELDVSDETAQTVVVLFDETVRDLLKCSPESLLEDDTETPDGGPNLPRAILDLIGTYHIFELKSHTYFEHGTFKSFTSWKIRHAPPAGESAGSSNLEAGDGSASSPMKRLSKERLFRIPSVYSVETCDEYEDSDMELQDGDQTGIGGGSAPEKRKNQEGTL
ncbi:hypothetical protein OROHE_015028 [Orobanche hederae]